MYQSNQAGMCATSYTFIQDIPSLLSSFSLLSSAFMNKLHNIVIAQLCSISCLAHLRKVVELVLLLCDDHCVKMDLRGVGCDGLHWIQLAQRQASNSTKMIHLLTS
jgi:hypothetical protein